MLENELRGTQRLLLLSNTLGSPTKGTASILVAAPKMGKNARKRTQRRADAAAAPKLGNNARKRAQRKAAAATADVLAPAVPPDNKEVASTTIDDDLVNASNQANDKQMAIAPADVPKQMGKNDRKRAAKSGESLEIRSGRCVQGNGIKRGNTMVVKDPSRQVYEKKYHEWL